ncbi:MULTISPECIES: hypothetical protein [unclassified Rhodanobacter]|uniref:hypothetical protein n=1 Tax=unclassified Rhodanobacter TaxID=2621553 RepID=UPI001BE00548|nr:MULTISPECIES: hypothetical protein [unclassified Rhodanobacter]MBT2145290.1 hypothetical protein [Rhodanobacter sp. LX-99]MBT2149335.1 hypothetical protein [Rhodanobacter sp. LX-100]
MTHLAMNPAVLSQATPGNREWVGRAYLTAAAWIGEGWLSARLAEVGAVLRDVRNYPKPADAVAKAVRLQNELGGKLSRPDTAQRYREAAAGITETIPVDLAAWLTPRLEAIAGAIGDLSDARPANAIYRACGAGRDGKRGNRPADADDEGRDAALVFEVRLQQANHPELLQTEVFERVARSWSLGCVQLSPAVVQAAWKRRRTLS